MKVALDRSVLVGIVSDGEKEMFAKFNISKNEKRRKEGWVNLVEAVKEYRRQMETGLIPIIVEDFLGPVEVQFGGLRMELVEIKKLKEFMKMVELSDTESYKKSLLDRWGGEIEEYKSGGS